VEGGKGEGAEGRGEGGEDLGGEVLRVEGRAIVSLGVDDGMMGNGGLRGERGVERGRDRTSMKSARSSASEPLRSSRASCGSVVARLAPFRPALSAFRERRVGGGRAAFWITGPERHSRKVS